MRWIANALVALLLAGPAAAERTETVDGELRAVFDVVDAVFTELAISPVDSTDTFAFSMAVGVAENGSRVIVTVGKQAETRSRITVTTESPEEPVLEQRVMEAILERLDAAG